MARKNLKKGDENTEINISPMIDMVFILLIFFIVTTVFVDEEGIDIDRPEPSTEQPENQNESDGPIKFFISKNGEIIYSIPASRGGGTREVNITSVTELVQDRLANDDVPVILEVQEGGLSGSMVRVMDAAYRAKEGVKISVSSVD